MRRTIAPLIALCLLTLAPAGIWAQAASASGHGHMMTVDNAKTPADHQALASQYRQQAADARAVAKQHREMAQSYLKGKVTYGKLKKAQDMKEHCEQIAQLNDKMATQFDELAKGEEAAAM